MANLEKICIKYAVIILNYNTIDDAIAAAESVNRMSKTDRFIICIADNASSKKGDTEKCATLRIPHVVTRCVEQNKGYAYGNNDAIRWIKEQYQADYYIIMNPDVLILNEGTIEGMIDSIENSPKYIVGGQPLVWNCFYPGNPSCQQNIRMIPNYGDLCILSCLPLKLIFRKRFKKITYMDQIPYEQHIEYMVPSGAFFIIKADIFEEIGLFDENTFLYFEEQILGKKLEYIGKKLLFMPEYMVRHEHGKSTGNNHYSLNKRAMKSGRDSHLYYAKEYLKVGKIKLGFLCFLHIIDYVAQMFRVGINKMIKNHTKT
ncbi:MAG: glycosyltransferase family 2 protein [Lachnospiraceae bacterium]|nr:glycosyltransferase family 2 protein [Lachnospiraceae bacterium]